MLSTISTIYDFSFGTFETKVQVCSTNKSSATYKNTLRGYKMKILLWLPSVRWVLAF